jgi:hypothetical protein
MEWPWQYSFPPFFTLQPHAPTREKQLEAWKHLVLSYCQVISLYSTSNGEWGGGCGNLPLDFNRVPDPKKQQNN